MRPAPGISDAQFCEPTDRNSRLQLVQEVRPNVRKADRITRINRQNRRQDRIENTQPHSLLVRIDDMNATAAPSRNQNRITKTHRLSEPAEPGSDHSERAHEAARPQQLPPRPP